MKLNPEEASDILFTVSLQLAPACTMRFGQALFNELPKETADLIHGTENDFFYWTDDVAVMEAFFEHCVQDGK